MHWLDWMSVPYVSSDLRVWVLAVSVSCPRLSHCCTLLLHFGSYYREREREDLCIFLVYHCLFLFVQ
jgi:hypothetical protein